VLGIETSCDETAAAIVEDGRLLRSNVIASQLEMHARYGGIVPEVASRQHVLAMAPAIQRAVDQAGVTLGQVDAVAVTHGPGLAGALLVGLNAAKALAFTLGVPLLGVNHLEGHIYASWLLDEAPDAKPGFPLLCLIASGGHTDLLLMADHGRYQLLGRTRDDAAGEAFDKAARVLGLGFPGGPHIQRVAVGATGAEWLPRAWMKETHDFSFSGLKTALLHRAQALGLYPSPMEGPDRDALVKELAWAFQESVADVMVTKTLQAAREHGARGIVMGGGVIANARLRELILERSDLPVVAPPPVLCTDNGAMIAACAAFQLKRGQVHALSLDVEPGARIG
jgi:N6-L-threonylcarbamoyladenine synthase